MKLLKKTTTRIGFRMVGVTVPPRTYAYICLYCIAFGITKAGLFKILLAQWSEEQKEKNPDSKLIQKILKRIQTELNLNRRKFPEKNIVLEEFKDEVRKELLEKGIIASYVELIVNGLE